MLHKAKVGIDTNVSYEESPYISFDLIDTDRTTLFNVAKDTVVQLIEDGATSVVYNGETKDREYAPPKPPKYGPENGPTMKARTSDVINIFGNAITSAYQYQRCGKSDFSFVYIKLSREDENGNMQYLKDTDTIHNYITIGPEYPTLKFNVEAFNEIDYEDVFIDTQPIFYDSILENGILYLTPKYNINILADNTTDSIVLKTATQKFTLYVITHIK